MAIEILIGEVNEGSSSFVTVNFFNKDSVAVVPTNATYRIDCVTTGTAIKGATVIAPLAVSVEIPVTHEENAIINQTNPYEVREVTVVAGYGVTDEITESTRYKVNNLSFKT